ncbi:MAG: LysR family transcriptional regulator [Clostridia bacterium]|nr:LysR family transcriptional regulator [Clostridia bacterium]
MTIRHLKVFVEVYKHENITKAAESLFITQPTVTRAIQELEEHYGVTLFERINKRLKRTECANKLFFHANNIISSIDQMEKEMKNWDEIGVLRIGATPTIGSVFIPTIINKFSEKYPNIIIKTTINNGTELQKSLYSNQLDLVLIEGGNIMEHLHQEVFAEDKLILVMPPNDKRKNSKDITISSLKDDKFLLREQGSTSRLYLNHIFSKHGISVSPVMESISTHAIIRSVHLGIGISILPEEMVLHSIESGYVSSARIKDEALNRKEFIVWHKNKFLTKSAREFIEICKNIKS